MQHVDIVWNPESGGNIEHIAEHDLTPEDVEEVLWNPIGHDTSHSTGRPIVYGFTPDGRYILVVYEEIDSQTVYPITAYEIEIFWARNVPRNGRCDDLAILSGSSVLSPAV